MPLQPGTKVRILAQPPHNEFCHITNHSRWRGCEGTVISQDPINPLAKAEIDSHKVVCYFHIDGLEILDRPEYEEI